MNRRSIIIDGKTTSISLEAAFWEEIDSRAEVEGLSWANYLRKMLAEVGVVPNRAAAVKEKLLHQLQNEALNKSCQVSSRWHVKHDRGEVFLNFQQIRLLVGRGNEADIVLLDNEVSRVHLMLVHDGVNWWAVDLDAKNGSHIGRKKIKAEKLSHGVVIRIGNSSISLLE